MRAWIAFAFLLPSAALASEQLTTLPDGTWSGRCRQKVSTGLNEDTIRTVVIKDGVMKTTIKTSEGESHEMTPLKVVIDGTKATTEAVGSDAKGTGECKGSICKLQVGPTNAMKLEFKETRLLVLESGSVIGLSYKNVCALPKGAGEPTSAPTSSDTTATATEPAAPSTTEPVAPPTNPQDGATPANDNTASTSTPPAAANDNEPAPPSLEPAIMEN